MQQELQSDERPGVWAERNLAGLSSDPAAHQKSVSTSQGLRNCGSTTIVIIASSLIIFESVITGGVFLEISFWILWHVCISRALLTWSLDFRFGMRFSTCDIFANVLDCSKEMIKINCIGHAIFPASSVNPVSFILLNFKVCNVHTRHLRLLIERMAIEMHTVHGSKERKSLQLYRFCSSMWSFKWPPYQPSNRIMVLQVATEILSVAENSSFIHVLLLNCNILWFVQKAT